jgi:hypothetical protein
MARFDVYRNAGGAGLLLDVQADLMRELNTRIVRIAVGNGGA